MPSSLPTLVGFGETMVRYCPIDDNEGEGQPSCACNVLRTIAGDELNVCLDFSKLGNNRSSSWISSLPSSSSNNPFIHLLKSCTDSANVNTSHCYCNGDGEIGSFTMLPKQKRVHYRRKSSTFWNNQPESSYPWKEIFQGQNNNGAWLHATGITPLCGPQALKHWNEHLAIAAAMNIPVSIDINHRAALGTIEELWNIMKVQIKALQSNLKFFVFSLATLRQVAILSKVKNVPESPRNALFGGQTSKEDKNNTDHNSTTSNNNSIDDSCWLELLKDLRVALIEAKILSTNTALGCCFKKRDADGVQTRWSAVATSNNKYVTNNTATTQAIPTLHMPKDECGGGSAWSVGVIDGLMQTYLKKSKDSEDSAATGDEDWEELLRRGDLSAALCQEIVGDHSTTNQSTLDGCMKTYSKKTARIGGWSSSSFHLSKKQQDIKMQHTIDVMNRGKVLAILRSKNGDLAIQRGIELVHEMGATAIEVTTDTDDFENVLSTLCTTVGDVALVGVGTVMHASHVQRIAELGAVFALSPINPPGFVKECLRCGILPVPAAYTPTECWTAYSQGAKVVKLFPAHMWKPKVLKSMLGTGELGNIKICPSGGITPETAADWLDAGAFCVGMGTNLTGKDVKISKDVENFENKLQIATNHWKTEGKSAAMACIQMLKVYGEQ